MKYAVSMDGLRKAMDAKDIKPYSLAKLCGVKPNTFYSYLAGNCHMGEHTCKAVADALQMPLSEVFPEMVEKAGSEPGVAVEAKVDGDGKRVGIGVEDMMVGYQTLCPQDGVTLRVRCIKNMDGAEYNGYTIGDNECITIKTGVSSKNLNLDRIIVRTKKKFATEGHIFALSTPFDIDKELTVVVHSHGPKTVLSKGVEFAELIFL